MSRSLRDCYAKIDRADENIINLAGEVRTFLNPNPYLLRFNRDPEQGLVIQCFCNDSAVNTATTRFGVLVGEIVHHLRSSLNHLVYQLSSGVITTKTEFPIFICPEKYTAQSGVKIKAVQPSEAKALIELAQPYNGGGENDPLWFVHDFDIKDKHHVLLVIGGCAEFYNLVDKEPLRFAPLYVPLTNGAIIGRPTQPPVDMEIKTPSQVVFPKSSYAEAEPIIPRLTQVSEYVRTLIGQFNEFF